MDEKAIKLETRLAAIEYLVANLYAIMFQASRATPEVVSQTIEQFRESLKYVTFPGHDPVKSDLASAEFEAAVRSLLALIEQTTALARKTPL